MPGFDSHSAAGAGVRLNPPPGTYDEGTTIAISSTAAAQIFFRIGNGAWQSYAGPVPLPSGPNTLRAFARITGGATPTVAGNYLLTPPPPLLPGTSPDNNGNGLSDSWEKAFALTDPTGDPDGDGADNLADLPRPARPRRGSAETSAPAANSVRTIPTSPRAPSPFRPLLQLPRCGSTPSAETSRPWRTWNGG